MDPLRTLLLARTHTVVLDPDRVASAATRPTRDVDLEKFEDELAQLGYVMSLDLAMTMRRLPHQTILELRTWISATLAMSLGAHRPHVPLFRGFRAATPGDAQSLYLRRMLTWILTRPSQPCPWCGQLKSVGVLDPCGHLVCQSCWDGGTYAGCPICHRRVAIGDPFVRAATTSELVTHHDGELRLLYLGFDLVGTARDRFERLVGSATPLSPDDRAEIETVIDTMGPKTVQWLPAQIPVKETLALVLARLWMVAADRKAMVHTTHGRITTATDVLRIVCVLLGGNPGLVEPMRLGSIGRGMRRAVLEALERLPADQVVEDMWRHRGLWKRVGERLHPYEMARRMPVVTLGFAAVRQTQLSKISFAAGVVDEARGVDTVRISDDRARVVRWASLVEARLRDGDARGAADRLAERPGELLRRVDQLIRVVQARQPDALAQVIHAIETATTRGTPAMLLGLASHIARRTQTWPRRVFFPKGDVMKAWATGDARPPLRSDAVGALVAMIRAELVNRAATRRNFARAVIDRGLADLLVPFAERNASRSKVAWPRGSHIALPAPGETAVDTRLFLHWEAPAGQRVDLDLSVVMFDADWQHVETCDYSNLVVQTRNAIDPSAALRVAVHSGDLTSAPPPLGASEFVDLDLVRLRAMGVRHAVMVVFSYNNVPFDQLPHGFAGVMLRPREDEAFDPRAVVQRFDLHGRSVISVPLVLDLAEHRLRWLDVHVTGQDAIHHAGGYRAALAHLGRDYADLVATGARPTMWDLAAIHAVARANIVYVRNPQRTGGFAVYRRRDKEQALGRLARLYAGDDADGTVDELPPANAPTWFALLRDDLALPAGSTGYVLDGRGSPAGVERLAARDLISELSR